MLVKSNNLVNQYFLKLRGIIIRFLRDAPCGKYVAEAAYLDFSETPQGF